MKNLSAPHGVAIVCMVLPLALGACGRGAASGQQGAPPAPPVAVANPIAQDVVDWDSFVGRFEASKSVEVRARVGGYVQAVNFRDGQYVNQGQLLFTLDPRPAQAQLDFARAQLALAKADYERAEKLVKETAISQQEFDAAKAAFTQAEATAQARELDLEFTKVTAPMSGMVSDRRADPGNLVSGGSAQATVLTTIVATNPIYLTFDASEAQLLKYQRQARSGKAAPVKVRLQDEADYKWQGRLDFADNAVDASSGAVRLRAAIDNKQNFIRPGMFGNALVVSSPTYKALMVPDQAIMTQGAAKMALVVAADGAVTPRPVELGPLDGSLRVVRSGLQPSDLVVVSGVQRAQPGQKVTPQKVQIKQEGAPAETARGLAAPSAMASAPPASK
ncbi:MAG: efflux RND transporter periplasmic adaptor subunit [Pseudomonadota bacterium]